MEIKKSKVDAKGVNTNVKSKYSPMCILSFGCGLIAAVSGTKSDPDYLWCVFVGVMAILGTALAFAGRNKAKANNTKGKGLALAGFILSLMMIVGVVGYNSAKLLGNPTQFGIDSASDHKMFILIVINFITVAICAVVGVIYARLTRKK